jgi:hypothetical protein
MTIIVRVIHSIIDWQCAWRYKAAQTEGYTADMGIFYEYSGRLFF